MNVVCVDFDGTMVDHRFPEVGPPVPGAIEWMKTWQGFNINIILFTMRSDGQNHGDVLADAIMWAASKGIYFYGSNENPDQRTWSSSPKPYGQVYVDDAAFGCPLIHPEGFSRPCVDWNIVGPGVLSKFGIKVVD